MSNTIAAAPELAASELNVSYSEVHQVIEGFGASDAWSIDPTINKWMQEKNEAAITDLADKLFSVDKGIGLSAWRFNVGAGSAEQREHSKIPDPMRRAELIIDGPDARINNLKQEGQIHFLKAAYHRGVTEFVVFSNSPPIWMTKNGLSHPGNGKGIGSSNLSLERTGEFADFLVKVVSYLRGDSVGVPINYVSPINEPTWHWEDQTQEANRYNLKEMKQVYRDLDKAIRKAGLGEKVEIDGGEVVELTAALSAEYKLNFDGKPYSGGMNNRGEGQFDGYIDSLLGDPEMRRVLNNKISVHGYWSEANTHQLGRLRDLFQDNLVSTSPEARLWMSEICILGDAGDIRAFTGPGFDANDMDYALHIARIIHRDMTRLNASAWFWWLALTPYDYKDGLIKISPSLDAASVEYSKLMWTLGNFSRFIRPGYQRVELPNVDNLEGIMASAYRSPDDSELIVVVVNTSHQPETITLNAADLPRDKSLESFAVHLTDAHHDLISLARIKLGDQFTLPARSTVTFQATIHSTD